MKSAEDIKFVGDENGWEMHVTTEDGFVQRYNIHGVAWGLVGHMNDTIGRWYREGLAAATDLPHSDPTVDQTPDYDLGRDLARGK